MCSNELIAIKMEAQEAKELLEEERCQAHDLERGVIMMYKESEGL